MQQQVTKHRIQWPVTEHRMQPPVTTTNCWWHSSGESCRLARQSEFCWGCEGEYWVLHLNMGQGRKAIVKLINAIKCLLLPHSALSWNLSSAENLARFSLQDRATEWHYFHQEPPPPRSPRSISSFSQLSLQPLEGSFSNFKCRLRGQNQNWKWIVMKMTSNGRQTQNIKKWNISGTTFLIILNF